MKKLAIVLASVLAVSVLAGCGNSTTSGSSSSVASSVASSAASESASTADTSNLETLMDSLFNGIPAENLPMTMPTQDGKKYASLTEENSEYNVGVARDAYVDGIVAEAAISAQAHSVCLLTANSEEEAAKLAEEIAEKANPNKWVCVMAEHKTVAYSGNTVLLAMTFEDFAQPILDNFKSAFGADKVTVVVDETLSADADMGIGADASQDTAVAG